MSKYGNYFKIQKVLLKFMENSGGSNKYSSRFTVGSNA